MSVSAAGSASSVQNAVNALRQTVQAEHVVASALSEAAAQAAKEAMPSAPQDAGPRTEGVGDNVDVRA
jgi:hypothetical protein